MQISARQYKAKKICHKYGVDSTVKLGDVSFSGNSITVGENTYINSGYLQSGDSASIRIGKWCAIGYNVSIIAETHDMYNPTGPVGLRPLKSANIVIGNGVWIGSNVMILPGVTIGDYAVIGANMVVRKDIPERGVLTMSNDAIIVFTKEESKCRDHKKNIESNNV